MHAIAKRQLPIPAAFDAGGHDPLAGRGRRAACVVDGIGLPRSEIPRGGDDARARARLREDLRTQQAHQLRKEPHEDDIDLAEIGVEGVLMHEADAIGESLRFRFGIRLLHELRVDVHADSTHARASRERREHDAPVARPEIDHRLAAAWGRELHHALHVLRIAADERREPLLCTRSESVPGRRGRHERQE